MQLFQYYKEAELFEHQWIWPRVLQKCLQYLKGIFIKQISDRIGRKSGCVSNSKVSALDLQTCVSVFLGS